MGVDFSRCDGDDPAVRSFGVYYPKALAGIGDYMADMVTDRSIRVSMQKKLNLLNIGENNIKDISVVQNFSALEVLDIRATSVQDLSQLTRLRLVRLDAGGSLIIDLGPLGEMENLKTLRVNQSLVP